MNIAPWVMILITIAAWVVYLSGHYVEHYKMIPEDSTVDHNFELLMAVVATVSTLILWLT